MKRLLLLIPFIVFFGCEKFKNDYKCKCEEVINYDQHDNPDSTIIVDHKTKAYDNVGAENNCYEDCTEDDNCKEYLDCQCVEK